MKDNNYTYYLLLATGVIVLLTLIGLMALPILFVALPIIGLIAAVFIWTADDVKVTIHDNTNNKD